MGRVRAPVVVGLAAGAAATLAAAAYIWAAEDRAGAAGLAATLVGLASAAAGPWSSTGPGWARSRRSRPGS